MSKEELKREIIKMIAKSEDGWLLSRLYRIIQKMTK